VESKPNILVICGPTASGKTALAAALAHRPKLLLLDEATSGLDPVVRDGRTEMLRGQVAGIARELDPALTIHDFRITAGPIHTNVLFDVVVPYGFRLSDEEVRGTLSL